MSRETQHDRYKLATLGSGKVGKTALIRRYLNNTFTERYKETVEDIYSRDLSIRGVLLALDIYDTNFYYPDMRKLTIASASAFLIVFSIDNVQSFKDASDLLNEIMERRCETFSSLAIVIAGTKSDIEFSLKKIHPETVNLWISRLRDPKDQSEPCINVKYVECSSKVPTNIDLVFKTLLDVSGFPYAVSGTYDAIGPSRTPAMQRRNLSVRAKSPTRFKSKAPANTEDVFDESVEDTQISRGRHNIQTFAERVPKALTRHGSLMRKTQRLSVKMKHADRDTPDDSECKMQ